MVLFRKITITLFSALALAFLLYPGVSALKSQEREKPDDNSELINGAYINEMRISFEREISLRKEAVEIWSALRYHLFREGNSGVLIGNDNWLFTAEEYDEQLSPQINRTDFFLRAAQYKSNLAEQGIDLQVILIPSKSRIYSEKIDRYGFSEPLSRRYESSVEEFESLGITVVNLLTQFSSTDKKEELFYQFDTHWTIKGTEAAAAATALTAAPLLYESSTGKRQYRISDSAEMKFAGDLLPFVPALEKNILENDLQESYREIELVDDNPPTLGLFDDPVIPVLLAGTSYSYDSRWNFENTLKLALQADVLNLAKEGEGPLAPMDELMESGYFRETGSSLVLWEVPERYIPIR